MFGRRLSAPAVAAIRERLEGIPSGLVGVVSRSKLAALLRDAGHPVVLVEPSGKRLRRGDAMAVVATAEQLPFAPASLAALIVDQPGDGEAIERAAAVVKTGGLVVLLDGADRRRGANAALAGGLVEIEQARAGRTVITSGLAMHWS